MANFSLANLLLFAELGTKYMAAQSTQKAVIGGGEAHFWSCRLTCHTWWRSKA